MSLDKKFIYAVFCLFISFVNQLNAHTEKTKVRVFIILHGESGLASLHSESHELLAQSVANEIGNENNLIIKASSWNDVVAQLKSKLPPSSEIETLFIGTHSKTNRTPDDKKNLKLIMGPSKNDLIEIAISTDDSVPMVLNSNGQEFFNLLRGNFSESARIMLPICNAFSCDTTEAVKMASAWATLVEMKSGTIFGLYTAGSFPLIFGKLPWNLKSGVSKKIVGASYAYLGLSIGAAFLHPVLAVLAIGFPLALGYRKFAMTGNQGYEFTVADQKSADPKKLSFWEYRKTLGVCQRTVADLSRS